MTRSDKICCNWKELILFWVFFRGWLVGLWWFVVVGWVVGGGGGVCVCSWYGVVCAAVVVVVVGCFRDALVVNALAWENMMGLVACFVGLCDLGND